MFEYIMLKGVNDYKKEVFELVVFFGEYCYLVYVNLIFYNLVDEYIDYECSIKEDVFVFYDILKKNGINCVICCEYGIDIDVVCG